MMNTQSHETPKSLPNFVRWCMDRFGPEFTVSPNGSVTCEAFRAAKKLYEDRIGFRVYSPEYEAVFYPENRS